MPSVTDFKEKILLKDRLKNHTTSLVMVIISMFLLIMTGLYAYMDGSTLSNAEIAVFRAIQALPNWLTPFFVLITNIATLGAVILAGFAALVGQKRRIGLAILASGVLAWTIANLLKDVVGRGRPEAFLGDAAVRYADLASGYGFPSGHSTVAAACAMSLILILPRKYAFLLITLVLLVGVSRIYLGVHLPLDVVGGWAIGIIIGYVVDFMLRVESVKAKKLP